MMFPFRLAAPIVVMGLVILVSNELVQHPVQGQLFNVDLSGILTWGAFTYPIAFLVTDTTNRLFGVGIARRVVAVGFIFGVALTVIAAIGIASGVSRSGAMSLWQALFYDADAFAMLRTALASGSAFLTAQLLDIKVFDVLRQQAWWKAPAASSLVGSFIDTLLFFFLAFAGTGLPWASWAVGDFCAKLVMIALLLYPFRLVVRYYPQPLQDAP
ncbi:MAG: queuosine precursor transporter [Gammaproteobacteria bacterium]|nr:queuosine precursor transporter [Gammaproteobacteria bacterium]